MASEYPIVVILGARNTPYLLWLVGKISRGKTSVLCQTIWIQLAQFKENTLNGLQGLDHVRYL